jgi:hypothetical protein
MATLDRPSIEYKTPADLVRDVQRGIIRVPPFQRGFKWEATDVTKLFDSLYRGYPIGNLLLWRRPASAQELTVGPVTIDAPETESALWVVDGQQRITSIVGALIAAEETADARFRIYLNLNSGVFRSVGARQQPPVSWVPVSMLLDTVTLIRWMRANAESLSESQIALADQAAKAIREYQIPTYVVTSSDEEPLIEIFSRMNETGKPLSRAESFRALNSGLAGNQPTDLRSIGLVPAELGFGGLGERLVLRCILAFRGGDIFREDFHDEFSSESDLASTYQEVAALLRDVVTLLQNEVGIPHIKLLPYSHVIPVLVRFMRVHGKPDDRVSALLRRWVWRSAIAGTRARGISVVDVRHQVFAIDRRTPLEAARELLDMVPPFLEFVPDLGNVNLKHAMTKVNVLGFLSAEPRDLQTGQLIEIRTLLEDGSPLRSIIIDHAEILTGTIANRILYSMKSATWIQRALISAPPDIAASHLIASDGLVSLLNGDYRQFLVRRSEIVSGAIGMHVERMSERGARDGRSIADIIRSVA